MKKTVLIMSVLYLGISACTAQNAVPKSEKEKSGYSIGYDIGSSLAKQDLDVDAGALANGIRDAMTGTKSRLSQDEMRATLEALQQKMQARQNKERSSSMDKNATEGEAFLAKNKKKAGVKTTASGLQYKVIKAGSGPKPSATDQVKVHYKGTLINGKEFDSSYGRGEPAVFGVNQVISGWTEALQLMSPGAKFELYIPANLAYGERGAGSDIGPNSTLIFTVELLEIVK